MSAGEQERRERREDLEAWWGFISRILAFMLGVTIIVTQVVLPEHKLDWLEVLIAAPLMGPAVVQGVAQILVAAREGEGKQ